MLNRARFGCLFRLSRTVSVIFCGSAVVSGSVAFWAAPRQRSALREASGTQKSEQSAQALPHNFLSGMPPVLNARDIYSADRPDHLGSNVRIFPSRIYVPNTESNSVDVIDPTAFQVIDHFQVGQQPQHIVPSYDLKTLWVLDDEGNALTRIDPSTGKKGETIRVDDPYNLYFTPDAKNAIVVAERLHRLDFRDPHTMELKYSLPVTCAGVNHLDFSADGLYLIASCEFDGKLLKIDAVSRTVSATRRGGSDRRQKLGTAIRSRSACISIVAKHCRQSLSAWYFLRCECWSDILEFSDIDCLLDPCRSTQRYEELSEHAGVA